MNALYLYRAARWCHQHHLTLFAKIIYYFQLIVFHNYIPYTAEIGKGTYIPGKSTGIYIHARAKIGKNCIIGHQVTIGGSARKYEVPVLGDDVYVGPGSKIVGNVVIGNDVVIGVNSVVVKNIESGCVVAGVPAKVLKTGIKMHEYV